MPELDLNWLAVIAATVVYYALGAIWYQALSTPWLAATGRTREQITEEGGNPATYLWQFLATLALVVFAGYLIVNAAGVDDLGNGALMGLLLGVFGSLASSGDFLFEQRNLRLFLINGGYRVVGLTLAGVLFAVWQ